MDDRRQADRAPIDSHQPDADADAAPDTATVPIEPTPDVQESEAHPS